MAAFFRGRFLVVYSGVLTLVFAATLLTGFTQQKKTEFDEITVHRINVVEPDGTIRLVISNKANCPGSFIKGKEIPRPDREAAGLLFVDDEGTEDGGLMWGGKKDPATGAATSAHLSFDRYMQDQVFSIDAQETRGKRSTLISISDVGDWPITELFDELPRIRSLPADQQQAAAKKFFATHTGDHQRVSLGRETDKSVALRLRDTEGRERLVIRVEPDGKPVVQFLDENGKVVSQLPQAK